MKLTPESPEACGLSFGPEIFGLCRSKAVEDHGIVSFPKSWVDLHSFEGLIRWSSQVYGGAWRRVRPFLCLQFLGFVDRGPMDLVVASFFVKYFLDLHKFE